jgi:hypothetical protein
MTMRKKFLEEENFSCSPFHLLLPLITGNLFKKEKAEEKVLKRLNS